MAAHFCWHLHAFCLSRIGLSLWRRFGFVYEEEFQNFKRGNQGFDEAKSMILHCARGMSPDMRTMMRRWG